MAKLVKCKTCGNDVAKSAKACPHCGAKQKKFRWWQAVLVVIVVAGAWGALTGDQTTPQAGTSGQSAASQGESAGTEAKEPTNNPKISMDEFKKIESGMTYAEVVEIIGSNGELLSEVDVGMGSQYVTQMFMWEGQGSFGANANITFQGGKVTAKAQIGLG